MRDMSSGMNAALDVRTTRPILFVELDFLSAPVRFWGGVGPFEWDEKTWTGAGELLSLSDFEETTDGSSSTLTGVLSGVPSELTGAVYADQYQRRDATAWLGLFDATWELIDEPIQIRRGIMDTIVDVDDGEKAIFRLSVETAALDQGNNRSWRLTHEIQNEFFPGDDLLKYTVALQGKPLRWGATSAPQVQIASFLRGLL